MENKEFVKFILAIRSLMHDMLYYDIGDMCMSDANKFIDERINKLLDEHGISKC